MNDVHIGVPFVTARADYESDGDCEDDEIVEDVVDMDEAAWDEEPILNLEDGGVHGLEDLGATLTILLLLWTTLRNLLVPASNAETFVAWAYLWPTVDGSHITLRGLPACAYNLHAALLWPG